LAGGRSTTDNQLAGYFSYLDKLNRMAITNMRRAAFYLECRFLIDREQADTILRAWLLRLFLGAYTGIIAGGIIGSDTKPPLAIGI
jgi:hypothetical protein